MERTLILLKPDCVQRRLVGQVIRRFEDKGYQIIAMKLMQVTPELAQQHYAEHLNKPFYPELEKYITGGPIVAAILEGPEAIGVVRNLLGATNGREAAPGTIRGDYGCSRRMNLVHGSDSPQAAEREIDLYFTPSEICVGKPALAPWLAGADEA